VNPTRPPLRSTLNASHTTCSGWPTWWSTKLPTTAVAPLIAAFCYHVSS